MVELPEAVCLAAQFNENIAGKKIKSAEAAHSPHKFTWYFGGPEEYARKLAGEKIGQTMQVGGTLEISTDNYILLMSEGLKIRLHKSSADLPPKHQLALIFEDDMALHVSVQMYAGICCFKPGEYDNEYYQAAQKKPSPLTDEFDEEYFFDMIDEEAMQKLSAKAFLATEQRVPGLGNGVLQEILYDAKINPKRKIIDLDRDDKMRMFKAVKQTLNEIRGQGGRDTESDIFGTPGGYATRACKNTVGKPCGRCGSPIVKASYMGGSVYYCETCQPL